MTRYGARKQQEQYRQDETDDDTGVGPGRGSPISTPRWVKAFAIAAFVLILLLVIVLFTGVGGPHGPGRHLRSGDAVRNADAVRQPVVRAVSL